MFDNVRVVLCLVVCLLVAFLSFILFCLIGIPLVIHVLSPYFCHILDLSVSLLAQSWLYAISAYVCVVFKLLFWP